MSVRYALCSHKDRPEASCNTLSRTGVMWRMLCGKLSFLHSKVVSLHAWEVCRYTIMDLNVPLRNVSEIKYYGQGLYLPCGFDAILWAGLGVRGVVLLIK